MIPRRNNSAPPLIDALEPRTLLSAAPLLLHAILFSAPTADTGTSAPPPAPATAGDPSANAPALCAPTDPTLPPPDSGDGSAGGVLTVTGGILTLGSGGLTLNNTIMNLDSGSGISTLGGRSILENSPGSVTLTFGTPPTPPTVTTGTLVINNSAVTLTGPVFVLNTNPTSTPILVLNPNPLSTDPILVLNGNAPLTGTLILGGSLLTGSL